jgi:NAD(P)-dependent dehydrogenase (short-subunit alcohol dehydrogenase family)
VVGASSGLGRCIGVDRGQRGDQVALLARRKDRLVEAAAEAGEGALAVVCDVTDPESCESAIAEAAEGLGGIDSLVYASGVGPLAPVEKLTAADWRRAVDTNLIGAALVTSAALPHLLATGGTAAYLSSVSASLQAPRPGFAAYTVTKAALDKLIEALSVEHPTVGFTRIVVGDCGGGEGHGRSEFPNDWDWNYAAQLREAWQAAGVMDMELLNVVDLLNAIHSVLTSAAWQPSVAVLPRPGRGIRISAG